jgi:sugar/nucleoside kinase (ribokinase family)
VSRFDYVTVGHVTVDVVSPGGERRPGGGAFYSALQAARLGLSAQIVTRGNPRELAEMLEPYRHEFDLHIWPAEHTTTLATCGVGAGRRQRVLSWAGSIAEPQDIDTAILHLAPVARETPSGWSGRAQFVGVTPQGLVRRWDERGEISLVTLDRGDLPQRCDALVISDRERRCCEWLIATIARGETAGVQTVARRGDPSAIAITAGPSATTVLERHGAPMRVRVPVTVDPRDDLGAGDVFAAAFFVALREGRQPAAAAAYGNAAAAVRIAGIGPNAVGSRHVIEAVCLDNTP